jgi:CrcB protein
MKYLWVALGGALGSLTRYAVGLWIYQRTGTRYPYATFAINISGCFIIGFALTLLDRHLDLPPAWRLAIPIGFVGAYTTFSSFEYETIRLAQHGQPMSGLLYVLLSVIWGYIAVWLGMAAARPFA